jgi:hypothetical protein
MNDESRFQAKGVNCFMKSTPDPNSKVPNSTPIFRSYLETDCFGPIYVDFIENNCQDAINIQEHCQQIFLSTDRVMLKSTNNLFFA